MIKIEVDNTGVANGQGLGGLGIGKGDIMKGIEGKNIFAENVTDSIWNALKRVLPAGIRDGMGGDDKLKKEFGANIINSNKMLGSVQLSRAFEGTLSKKLFSGGPSNP
ncbi:MAG: hypothetical protein LBG48_04690 [Rickettsiales bacterium]|jgi:hypothetical protein|nr:hypothetical protein [Rickettsiales bacterium]